MPKSFRSQKEIHQWIGYTDILASSLLVVMLVAVVASLNNATNRKPPLIKLTEAGSFRFGTGRYELSAEFREEMDSLMPLIVDNIQKYGINTVEVIGHTDGQPSSGASDLDLALTKFKEGTSFYSTTLRPGSNIDLGFLRALSVASYIRESLKRRGLDPPQIVPYSAGSLINTEGKLSPADTSSQSERRRIEIRFTRFQ